MKCWNDGEKRDEICYPTYYDNNNEKTNYPNKHCQEGYCLNYTCSWRWAPDCFGKCLLEN